MGTSSRCYICDLVINKKVQKSLFDIKTQHSRIPVAGLLERIQKGIGTIRPHGGSNICVLCDNCVDKINAYDEAHQLAERVEAQLKKMMDQTKERYQNVTILDTEHMKMVRKPKDFAMMMPDDAATDPFELMMTPMRVRWTCPSQKRKTLIQTIHLCGQDRSFRKKEKE